MVPISINLKRTRINDFQFYSGTGPTNTKLVLNEQVLRSLKYLALRAKIVILIFAIFILLFILHFSTINLDL